MNTNTHFLRLVAAGSRPGPSSGEGKAFNLAHKIVDEVPGLDGRALEGLCAFVYAVSESPMSAREFLDGLSADRG
jgi:hypothetical protein